MYSIIELQTTAGQTAHIYQTAATRDEAMSKYHSVLAYAAASQVEYHACIVMDEQGQTIARECYEHLKNPLEKAEEPSEEPTDDNTV